MNKTVLRALVTLTVAALVSVQSLVAAPFASGTKSVLGGPTLSIGAAKTLTGVTLQLNGSYNVTYLVVVHNYSNVALNNVQVTDNLVSAFPAPATFSMVGVPVATGGLVANGAFNGNGDINLLAAGSTLAPDAEETITFTVNVAVNSSGMYYNTAIASGENNGTTVSDSSDYGTEPDPSNPNSGGTHNTGEPGENDPTPTPLGANTVTQVGLAKTIVDTTFTNCQYIIDYQIVVRNMGTEALDNIQVTDNLNVAFPLPATYTVSNVTLGGPAQGTAALGTPPFDGNGTPTFLDPANTSIGVGQDLYIFFTVTVDLNGGTTQSFGNVANVTAQGAFSNQATADVSDWGTQPDQDLDGNPNEQGENDSTFFVVDVINVGVSKYADVAPQPDGSYNVTYVITLKNFSDQAVSNISLTDDLSQTFPSPVSFTFVNNPFSSQGSLPVNLGYGSGANWQLLDPAGFLGPNASADIVFTINVDLNNTTDTLFLNSAFLSITGSCGQAFADTSMNGNNPDPNGNGNPNDAGEAEPTPIVLIPTETVIPNGFSPNGDGINDNFFISNIGGKKVKIEIFNRWGAPVFVMDNYDNSWNGQSNTGIGIGDQLPTGTYWYVISIDDTKEVKEYANYLTLSR